MPRIHSLCTTLVIVVLALAGCTTDGGGRDEQTKQPTPSTPQQTTMTAEWGKPVPVDGYTITFTTPVDATENYPCTGCDTGVLLTTATITAGNEPLDPRGLLIEASDANYSTVGMTPIGDMVIPANGTHVEKDVQIHANMERRKGLIVIRLTGATKVVEWRQESR